MTGAIRSELQGIADAHGGFLRAADVVAAAERVDSPLHSHFEWSDTKAAREYRLVQARQLIRVLVNYIGPETNPIPTRVFVSLPEDRKQEGGGYRILVNVMNDNEQRRQLLIDALLEMRRFQTKYGHLRELAALFEAMRAAEKAASPPPFGLSSSTEAGAPPPV